MLDALIRYLGTGAPLAPALLQEAADLARKLHNGYDFDAPARLSELAVLWVLANPQPVTIEKPEYTR
ncbi:hypothetical protein MT997_07525 [Paenibacillus sp. OVF10]|nr:hypothetical protein MT997_07525 [Paenibacillus sp. OVF10]